MLHSRVADIREARRVASHEAGHAIARHAVGVGVDYITIIGNGEGLNGRVIGDACDGFDRLIILCAGRAGERAHLGEADDLGGSDLRKAEAVARLLAPNSSSARDFLLDAATREARAIIRKRRRAFDALVVELLARSVMDGRAVVELIERNL